MKIIKILVLFLAAVGIILFIFHKKTSTKIVAAIPSPQANLVLVDGRQCYTYNHEAAVDAPYTVNEFIDITIKGGLVSGIKKGTQDGPDMTNGYTGTLTGVLNNNVITDVFSYVVEGSKNKEKEIYRTNKTGIEKMRYPLLEQSGMLVPDTTKDFTVMSYARVGCTGSN